MKRRCDLSEPLLFFRCFFCKKNLEFKFDKNAKKFYLLPFLWEEIKGGKA